MILSTLLVACGQDTDDSTNENDELVEESQETEQNKEKDNNSEEEEEQPDSNNNDADNQDSNNSQTTEEEETEENEEKAKTTNVSSDLNVHFMDVGQSDATLFQYSDNNKTYNILFDTGDWRRNDVVNYLSSQGISSLDLVVASHPDADHIGQLAEIMNKFDVDEVWMSGNESSSKTFQRAIEAVISSDSGYHEPRAGEVFAIGPMEIDVLYPNRITGASNEESVSLLFTYGKVRFLLTGDADQGAEASMMASGNVDADILQLGHHGSNTSSSASFIKAVSPEVAIYSAGAGNSYGHPHAEVVNRVKNAGVDLYGTDVHGTVIVTTDGKNYSVKTNKDGTVSPKSTGSTNSGKSTNNNSSKETEKNDSSNDNATNACVDINSASVEEVQKIKHIGPERAQDLIDSRPYSSVDQLTKIKGIGPARIDDIKSQGLACVK